VISAGLSVGESVEIIRQAAATPAGVVIALNRQERGTGTLSAVTEVEQAWNLKVTSIATLDTLVAYLSEQRGSHNQVVAIEAYRTQYGG
jgi:orotate phosphoribosyltransferase